MEDKTLPKEKEPLNDQNTETQPTVITLEIEEPSLEGQKEQAIKKVDEVKEKVKTPAIGCSLVLFLILNIAMLIVGVTTTKDCPKKPIIPIYLAIAGALGIVTKILPIVNRKKQISILNKIIYLLLFIEFIWMILGSYWIYSIYEPSYNAYDGNLYCHKTCYLMAFWLLTLHYIYILIILLIPCCIMYALGVAILCCGKKLLSLGE